MKTKFIALKPNSLNNKNIIIGFFDLIHTGHMKLLQNHEDCILTFINIPSKQNPFYTDEQRINNLLNLGFKKIHVFDVYKNNMSAKQFYETYLKHANKITFGSDCKIGSDQKLLKDIIPSQQQNMIENKQDISTTKIKQLLLKGDVEKANEWLYEPLKICNKVDYGNRSGHVIGYPTINFNLHQDLQIKDGVYLSLTFYKDKCYHSLSFWGIPKTINERNNKVLETHIIGFDKEIYKKQACVQLIKWIGPIKKYDSIDDLRAAIESFIQLWY